MKSTCHPILYFKIGAFSCIAVRDGDDWDRNCLYVDTGLRHVLIDTGNGDCSKPPGLLLERLAGEGVALDSIDTVVITHADIDHIAGVVDAHGAPMLPRARIVLTQTECEHRLSAALRFPNVALSEAVLDDLRASEDVPRARLPQVLTQLALLPGDGDGLEIVPGLRAIAAPGHTPGLIAVEVTSGDARLIFISDIYYGWDEPRDPGPGPKAIGDPRFHAALDWDPALALRSRDRVFAHAVDTGAQLMASHVRFPGLGRVARADAGWVWVEAKMGHPEAQPRDLVGR